MLAPGDRFPKMMLALPRGGTVTLPDEFGDRWAYVAFYRGHW